MSHAHQSHDAPQTPPLVVDLYRTSRNKTSVQGDVSFPRLTQRNRALAYCPAVLGSTVTAALTGIAPVEGITHYKTNSPLKRSCENQGSI